MNLQESIYFPPIDLILFSFSRNTTMSGKYLKSTACQYPNYEPVPTTPSGSIPSVRPSDTSRSIHRDRDILVALLEKDVQGMFFADLEILDKLNKQRGWCTKQGIEKS